MNEGPTRRRLVRSATARLGSAAEARWLVEHALGLDGRPARSVDSVLGLDEPVPPGVPGLVESLVSRRQAGEPVQYIIGRWPFRAIELAVDRRILIPRPETEQVVEVALAELERVTIEQVTAPSAQAASPSAPAAATVVDLGTGSGAIALSLAVEGGSGRADLDVWATDSSPEALDAARSNLASLRTARSSADRARLDRVRWAEGPWFAALPAELAGSIDVVVSNPPYVSAAEFTGLDPVVREWEPEGALVAGSASDGSAGLADVETIVADAPRWLTGRGVLVVELAPHQADAATALARRDGFADVRVEPDLTGRPRVLVARR